MENEGVYIELKNELKLELPLIDTDIVVPQGYRLNLDGQGSSIYIRHPLLSVLLPEWYIKNSGISNKFEVYTNEYNLTIKELIGGLFAYRGIGKHQNWMLSRRNRKRVTDFTAQIIAEKFRRHHAGSAAIGMYEFISHPTNEPVTAVLAMGYVLP